VAPAGAPPQLQQSLAPLQSALGPQFDCSSAASASAGSAGAPTSSQNVAGKMATSALSGLGQPQVPQRANVGSVVNGVMGR
jgi:hypothetical protein